MHLVPGFPLRLRVNRRLGGRIVRLATPVILAMLTQTAINVVDTILVGRLPPEIATPGQAALEISLLLLWLFGGFLGAIAVGTQALSARRSGERDPEAAGQVVANAMLIALGASLAMVALLWPASPFLFRLVNDNPRVAELGLPYWYTRLVGMIPMVLTLATKSFFDGIGRTHVHLVASVLMNVVNIVLAVGLIFGVMGLPRWEVFGAGVAAVVSSYVGFLIVLAALLLPVNRRTFRVFRRANLSGRVAWEVVRLSVPSGLATMALMSGFGLFLRIVRETDRMLGDGTANFTAAAIIIRFLSMVFVASLGYGTATATLVSQSLGEGRPTLAARYGFESAKIGMYAGIVLALLTVAFPRPILAVFTADAAVIDAGAPALRLMGAFLPVIVAALVFVQALYGAGNPRFVMVLEFVLHFFCLVPLAYLLGVRLDLGLTGVFASGTVYATLLFLAVAWKFREGRWQTIRI